jgi:hypothetical protein
MTETVSSLLICLVKALVQKLLVPSVKMFLQLPSTHIVCDRLEIQSRKCLRKSNLKEIDYTAQRFVCFRCTEASGTEDSATVAEMSSRTSPLALIAHQYLLLLLFICCGYKRCHLSLIFS